MACSVNLFNNEPRISFSNDFGDPQQPKKLENSYREAPVSSDFAFSAPCYSMISADEVFFKGKILPSKINTLRDELLASDDDDNDDYEGLSPSFAKGASRWKERLGLKRSHVAVPKKSDKIRISGGSLGSIDELKIQDIIHEDGFKGPL